MKIGARVRTWRLANLKTEYREWFSDGIIEADKNAVKQIWRCGCGAEKEVWATDIKEMGGIEAILDYCKTCQKEPVVEAKSREIEESESEVTRAYRSPGRPRGQRKFMMHFSMDMDTINRLEKYAFERKIDALGPLVCELVNRALDGDK